MKRFIAVLSILTTLFLISCATTSLWEGIPRNEAQSWQAIGVSPSNAREYRKHGFTPSEIQPWIQAGIRLPNQVFQWHKAGFNPRETSKWLSKGFNLEKAIKFKKQGLTVE